MPSHAIWLFDSACVLCSRSVQFTLRHERAPSIRFVAIQSAEGRALAQRHDVDPDDPSTFLFIENGVAFARSNAMIALSQHLKGPARIAGALGRILPQSWRDAAYGVLARNRYALLGHAKHCVLAPADQRHRFVL